ncbi:MAG: hypothetical protein U9Q80_07465 [Bacillota bacterium]|nr:hypothetical protein [Bacillota bacterium]
MKSKFIATILIVALILTMSACGKKTETIGDTEVETDKDTTTITNDQSEVVVSGDMNKSVPIPEGYPENILPVYDDLFIATASKNLDGSYAIIGFTDDGVSDVAKFYEKIFENAEVLMKDTSDDNYMNMGSIDGSSYTISSSPATEGMEYQTNVTIIFMPVDLFEGEEEKEEELVPTGELIIPEGVEMHEDYPEDIMPINTDGVIELAVAMQQGGKDMIGYMSTCEPDEILEYYLEIFKEAENFNQQNFAPTIILTGEIDDVDFEVGITINDENTGEDLKYKTLIRIVYQ